MSHGQRRTHPQTAGGQTAGELCRFNDYNMQYLSKSSAGWQDISQEKTNAPWKGKIKCRIHKTYFKQECY